MTRTRSRKVALAPDLRQLDDRAARASVERMAVTPLAGGCYRVESEGGTDTVDLPGRRCTCPDHGYRGVECKHRRRVAIEVTRDVVPPPGKREAACAVCDEESFVPETADPPLCDDSRLEPGDGLVVEVVYVADANRRKDPKTYAFPSSGLRRREDATIVVCGVARTRRSSSAVSRGRDDRRLRCREDATIVVCGPVTASRPRPRR
jgi:hypothetical protein